MIVRIQGKTFEKSASNGEVLFTDITTGLVYRHVLKRIGRKRKIKFNI